MAFNTPQFLAPDGVLRETVIFTTTLVNRFFTGTVDPTTVDVQISVRGSSFTSDPDLIVLEGNEFTIPNPSVYPDGLGLVAGENAIEVRAVSNAGFVSDPAITSIILVQEADIGLVPEPPTNVSIERLDNSVLIRAEAVEDELFRGFNFYASAFSGGGATGYQRINIVTVIETETLEETDLISSIEVDSEIVTNPDGTHVADPLYMKLEAAQVRAADFIEKIETVTFTEQLAAFNTLTNQENRIQTEFNDIREIPEIVERVRTTSTVVSVRERVFLGFNHDRLATASSNPPTVPYGQFAALQSTEPIFYVITSVFFDPDTQTEIESSFSIEVAGSPLTVTAIVGAFPQVSRSQISLDMIDSIRRSRPQVALQPGSVIRDTFIDPGSSEVERVRFLIDFLYTSASFALLLQLDGVDSNGESIPVSQSPRKLALKRAFFLTQDSDVQALVDGAFERLAANYQEFREPGEKSRGEVTFFTNIRPTSTVLIAAGTIVASGTVRYQTTVDSAISLERLASFFNPITGRFSVTVPIRAEEAGSNGDVGAGQIRSIVNGPDGLSVTNNAATFGGDDIDTNLELATKAQNRVASVDSGRERGYLRTVAGVPGVRQAFVVSAGDPMMQRDFDTDFNKHVGGHVDIYVRGENQATVTDAFAFMFEIAEDIQFVILGDPKNLQFRAQDPNLSVTNPIIEMLDDPVIGFEFKNATTGEVFDLTDVQIVRYDTIELSKDVDQPDVDFGDVLFGDYRFRTGEDFVLPRQPVTSLSSVIGQVSGVLPDEAVTLIRPNSALDTGGSVLAGSFVRITQVTVNGQSVPSGELIPITGEPHVLVGETVEFLDFLGANPLTIKVFNRDRTVEYKGPNDPSLQADFAVASGTQTEPVGIRRTSNSTILSGQQVLVDYEHDENFVVEYIINNLPSIAQDAVDVDRHNTANVLVKETVRVPVDLSATILLQRTATQENVDSNLRARLAQFFDGLRLGVPVRQSDIIGIIEATGGVSHVVTPITKMVRGAGAPILRENLTTTLAGDITYLAGDPDDPISTPTVSVFLVNEPLTSATIDGGGPENFFRGVFQDDVELNLQTVRPETLGSSSGNAFIIGNNGLNIPGFTDDATLKQEFPLANDQQIEEVRKSRTQNRIMVSITVDDTPLNHGYFVTYFVSTENDGVRDIEPGPVEQLVVGTLEFIYEEDRVQS